jgi:thymidylate kinase
MDGALSKRVLVYGSLPPHGRDLDLLVRPKEEAAIRATLSQAGFLERESLLARFGSCSVELVELASARHWDLPARELQALYDEGLELDGLRMLVRPAPHHALLILARRLAGADGRLDEKRRKRLEDALAEDPQAWTKAKKRATQWGAQMAMELLEQSYETGTTAPPRLRARARHERRSLQGGWNLRRSARRAVDKADRIPHPRRGTVVSFSGLDGSGKSSQAAALCETLDLLGVDAVVVRTRISWEDWLWAAVPHAKRLLEPCVRLLSALSSMPRHTAGPPVESVNVSEQEESSENTGTADDLRQKGDSSGGDPVRGLRERSVALTELWILIITFANAWSQWRLMYRQFFRGAMIVCDRYTLDSIVEMRYSYGKDRPLPRLRRMLGVLYPQPVHAYFLDVQPDTALRRKGEWGIQWLSEHRELYLQECGPLGVTVLDGERPQAELCAEIAREVWLGREQRDRFWRKRVRGSLRKLLSRKQGS